MIGSTVPAMGLAVAQGHAIFLDCVDNRYFALSPEENDAVLRLLAGEPISARAQRALTAATGIDATADHFRCLLATTGCSAAPRAAPVPASDWPARLSAIRHLIGTTVMLKARGFHASLERLARMTHGGAPGAAPDKTRRRDRVVGAHDWLSRHFTANDACLVRSLALANHLRSAGCAAQLVLAVRADPFAAHCWVEADEQVLNEEVDAVASFQPILIVR